VTSKGNLSVIEQGKAGELHRRLEAAIPSVGNRAWMKLSQ
jgi:hypothetical protein